MTPPHTPPPPRLRLRSGGNYQPAAKRVLVASDDDEMRSELCVALQKDGHHVVELADGDELLDYLDGSHINFAMLPPPDAIIASLTMTGLNGVGLLEELRRLDNRTPFIGLAEPTDASNFNRVCALGAAYIFEAPLRVDDVREALHSLPGGTFKEGKRARNDRLDACQRGTRFKERDSKR